MAVARPAAYAMILRFPPVPTGDTAPRAVAKEQNSDSNTVLINDNIYSLKLAISWAPYGRRKRACVSGRLV